MREIQLSVMGNERTEELKYYVENGQPYPGKAEAMNKRRGNIRVCFILTGYNPQGLYFCFSAIDVSL
jgi:hypothetical protein